MKRIYLILAAVMLLATGCKTEKQQLVWSVDAIVQGNGEVKIGFPTGEIDLYGDATLTATSECDAVVMKNCVSADYMLENPSEYTEDQLDAAQEVSNTFYVDTVSGTWKVDITGYARYGEIYIIIDEHWPKDSIE